MQSRLSRLRLLESSLSAGRQLRRKKIRDAEDKKCEEDQRGCVWGARRAEMEGESMLIGDEARPKGTAAI